MKPTDTTRALTTAQLRDLERELRSERARLERTMIADGSMTSDATAPGDLASRTPASDEDGVGLALETRTLERHQAILDAIRRLEAGSYGACTVCDESIPYGRLLAMPESARCVTCAARA
jgi:DnaK suppressor protein